MEYRLSVRILPEDWVKEEDLWLAHIKFNCTANDDMSMVVTDPEDYIESHKEFYESLMNGDTFDGEFTVKASTEPNCDINIDAMVVDEDSNPLIDIYDSEGNIVDRASLMAIRYLLGRVDLRNEDPNQAIIGNQEMDENINFNDPYSELFNNEEQEPIELDENIVNIDNIEINEVIENEEV